uniref:Zn(2)-C6 fungal-type domain-containing protein n=1 Tax=Bionectria ochroleuca TaxID=29856 RepID=A0A0B7KHX1_BIOOC
MSSGSNKRHRVSGDSSSPLRTAIACRACRDRKTRCSGHQPTCTYCFKAGVACEYGPSVVSTSSSNLDEWGARILDAIDNIPIPPTLPINSVLGVTHPPAQGLNPGPDCIPTGRSPIIGLSSILEWQVFNIQGDRGPLARYKQALRVHPGQHPLSQATGRESATCATETLLGLVDVFQAGFLPAIPVLDAADLRRYILHIGEYGDMWNVEACLVLIVAALASMLRPTSAFPQHASSTVSMALRYWNMAKKRLAWAFEGSGMVAAQCQLLAAMWYIHTSEPTAAFKMLNGSLLTIDTTPPSHGPSIGDEASHRRQQDELCDNIRYICISLL